ncbi:3-carboxy-cis,cis-muconate cycloisomerase, partial [Streptomyces sp. NPDC059374]
AAPARRGGAWRGGGAPVGAWGRRGGAPARDAAELAEGLRVRPDVMRAHLDLTGGAVVSERLSAELAAELGRARAKELLARLAAEGRPLAEAPELAGADLDPTHYTGSAGALTDRALERR